MSPGSAREGIALRAEAGGVVLSVRVRPRAAREGVRGIHGDRLVVAVSAAPERGRANEAVIDVLAGFFGVSARACVLLSGTASRDKTFRIEGVGADAVRARIEALPA